MLSVVAILLLAAGGVSGSAAGAVEPGARVPVMAADKCGDA